ncbi:MAG: hypothetical protein C0615_02285, partial [Desulfuromonas sp.]
DGGAGVNYAAPGDENGTCATVDCHYNNGTPAWNAATTAAPARCDNCHNNGLETADTLDNAAPNRGWHLLHVVDADSDYVNDCAECHGANDGSHTSHGTVGDGPSFNSAVLSNWDSTNNTCTNNCHTAGTDDWIETSNQAAQTGALVCNDCHGSDKILDAVAAVGGAFNGSDEPTSNAHQAHLTNGLSVLSGGCTECHPHAGTLGDSANTKHVDGGSTGVATNVDLDGTNITSPTETTAAWDNTCTNICHSLGTDDWTTTGLTCNSCHSGTYVGGDYSSTGQHGVHNSTQPSAYTDAAANNSTAGSYDFTCANCHGNTGINHMNNTPDVALGDYSAGNCNNNSCHQDGNAGAAALTANWTTGWVGDDSDACNNCHDNAPGTGAHSVHAIGIHAETIYDLANGGVETFPTAEAGDPHGDAAIATTINCSTCHFNTTTDWYNAHDSRCVSCHDTSNTNLGDNAITITDKSVHVDGTKDIAFMNINFKSKAQLRDDITAVTEINNNWTRTNGYKADTSYDVASSNLNTDDFADTTCTVACHNGNDVTWTTPVAGGDCSKCHTELPQ